jgi:signal transduction histidine kinase
LARSGAQVSASMEDFGEGISETDLPHIFKRFYQADRSRSRGGHGLGLSLAQSIARAHGMEIDVLSTRGKGTTFRMIFPERDAKGWSANAETLAGT